MHLPVDALAYSHAQPYSGMANMSPAVALYCPGIIIPQHDVTMPIMKGQFRFVPWLTIIRHLHAKPLQHAAACLQPDGSLFPYATLHAFGTFRISAPRSPMKRD